MKTKKHYENIAADKGAPADPAQTAPSISRGWIKLRSPLRYPLAALSFASRWKKLKRELDASPGLRSFEYRVSLKPFMIGMHVVWESAEAERQFVKASSHREFSSWSLKSAHTPALRLEHFTLDSSGRLLRTGGFYAYEQPSDLPDGCCAPFPEYPAA